MKPIRHILLSLAALACVLPTSAQTARKTKTCTAHITQKMGQI